MASFTILVVEDSQEDLDLLRYAFNRSGAKFRLGVARDGVEAQEYLHGEGKFRDRDEAPLPDLMLLDLHMPRKDGFEVLAWLRGRSSGFQSLPVIVLTSSAENQDVDKAYALGANSYLVKDGDVAKMSAIVKSIMEYADLIAARRRDASTPSPG